MDSSKSPTTITNNKEKRFLFHVPSKNIMLPFKAVSRIDAQHQFMNSDAAHYYGQAVLLTPDD